MTKQQDSLFMTQAEYMASCSKEEKRNFIFGGCLYDTLSWEQHRTIPLRRARRLSVNQLYCMLDYMTFANNVDVIDEPKASKSYINIVKAIEEKAPGPKISDEKIQQGLKEIHDKFLNQDDDGK